MGAGSWLLVLLESAKVGSGTRSRSQIQLYFSQAKSWKNRKRKFGSPACQGRTFIPLANLPRFQALCSSFDHQLVRHVRPRAFACLVSSSPRRVKGLQGDRQLGREVSPGRDVLQPGVVRQPPRAGGAGVERLRRRGLGQRGRSWSQRSEPGDVTGLVRVCSGSSSSGRLVCGKFERIASTKHHT